MSKKKNRNSDIPLPLQLVQAWTKKCPHIWDICEVIHDNLAQSNYLWDDRCYLPLDVFYGVKDTISENLNIELSQTDCPLIVALANWRRYKEIYSFDSDLVNILMDSASDDILVEESLKNLPFPSFYIDMPGDNILNVSGFFVSVNCTSVVLKDKEDDRFITLDFVGFSPDGNFDGTFIIEQGKTIKESFNKIRQLLQQNSLSLNEDGVAYVENFITYAMQLVLYICAVNAEVSENPKQKSITKRTQSLTNIKNIKDVFREVRKWDVGYKIGNAIRLSKTLDNQATTYVDSVGKTHTVTHKMRPHVRRGHFHHYWTGSEQRGDRRLILKWVAPAYINFNDESEIPATVTPVKA